MLEGELIYFVPVSAKPGAAVAAMLREVVPLAGARIAASYDPSAVTLVIAADGAPEAELRRIKAAGGVVHTPEVLMAAIVQQRLDKSTNLA